VVAAAVAWRAGRVAGEHVVVGPSGGPYSAGLLALRCGPLLEAAVGGLPQRPDLLLVDATGRDHPRRAGLALHLGARLGLPSLGVTNRVLVAAFDEPGERRGSFSPLLADGRLAGYAVRTRAGARPVLAHSAWRTTPEQARDAVLALTRRWRTPLPLRAARTLARRSRAAAGGQA
jgi:deoxyribonuclease V